MRPLYSVLDMAVQCTGRTVGVKLWIFKKMICVFENRLGKFADDWNFFFMSFFLCFKTFFTRCRVFLVLDFFRFELWQDLIPYMWPWGSFARCTLQIIGPFWRPSYGGPCLRSCFCRTDSCCMLRQTLLLTLVDVNDGWKGYRFYG